MFTISNKSITKNMENCKYFSRCRSFGKIKRCGDRQRLSPRLSSICIIRKIIKIFIIFKRKWNFPLAKKWILLYLFCQDSNPISSTLFLMINKSGSRNCTLYSLELEGWESWRKLIADVEPLFLVPTTFAFISAKPHS